MKLNSEFYKKKELKRIQFIVWNQWEGLNKKNSIGVSQIKILVDATIPFQIKPWEWRNEKLRREGQYRGIPRCKIAVFTVEGWLTYTWIIYEMNHPTLYSKRWLWWHDLHPAPDPRRGVLLWILGVGGPPVSPNLTPFQTQKCRFPNSFSDQISKIHTHFQTWPNLACSRLSITRGDSQFPPALFSCSRFLIQRTQLSRSLEQARPGKAEIMSSFSIRLGRKLKHEFF